MHGRVEGLLYLHLALAVHHPVVADMELDVPCIGHHDLGLAK